MLLAGRCDMCGAAAQGLCGSCRVLLAPPAKSAPIPPLESVTALFSYADAGVELIRSLKFSNRRSCLSELVDVLTPTLPPELDSVVSVPAVPRRRRRRGYDLPELLARRFGHNIGRPVEGRLSRLDDGSQRDRGRVERNDLARFEAHGRCEGTILLVDDVLTTGATARKCAAELLKSGAVTVHLCVLAVTPPPAPNKETRPADLDTAEYSRS